MILLLISSANVFALPKIKRIRISRTGTRLQRIAKETIVNGKLRYIRHGVSETTRATASTTAQQVERAAEQAQQSHAKVILPAVTNHTVPPGYYRTRFNPVQVDRKAMEGLQYVGRKTPLPATPKAPDVHKVVELPVSALEERLYTPMAVRKARMEQASFEYSQKMADRTLRSLNQGETIHAVALLKSDFEVMYIKDVHIEMNTEGLEQLTELIQQARNEQPGSSFLVVQTHQSAAVFRQVNGTMKPGWVRQPRNVIEYVFDQNDMTLLDRAADAPELATDRFHFLLDNVRPLQEHFAEFAWKAVYEDSLELARDVHEAYGGQGGVKYINALGEELVAYELPQGIVYKSPNNIFARTINPKQEVAIYYPSLHKGQLLKKDMLRLFRKADRPVAELPKLEEETVVKTQEGSSAAQETKATPVQTSAPRAASATPNPFVGQEVYTAQADLAHDVAVYYEGLGERGQMVEDMFGRYFTIYQLPREGIRYQPFGQAAPEVLAQDAYIILYNPQQNAGQLMRKDSPALRYYQNVGQ